MRVFPVLAFLISAGGGGGAAPVAGDAEGRWREVLAKVRVGMRRTAVEEVLGRTDVVLDFDPERAVGAEPGRKGRTALYLLDEGWCATVAFDASGFTTRNNPHLLLHLPENRVMGAPELWRRTAEMNGKIEREVSR